MTRPLRQPRFARIAALGAPWVGLACTHDVVLPDHEVATSVCGNGITEADEECDVTSPGCVDCQVQPEWTCTASGCSPLCVDGVVGTGASCEDPHRDTACDLSGFWAVRETTYLLDQVFQTVQVSSNWYLYEIAQTGDDFSLSASLDCGVHVTGSATIDYPPATSRSLVWQNPMDGTDPTHGKRHGTSAEVSDGCDVTMAPWYFVSGATTNYIPQSFSSGVTLEALAPLPSVSNPVGGNVFPVGATDPTTAGIPGFGVVISGLIPGLRYAAQRSFTSYAKATKVAASALTIVLDGQFDVQENVLRVTECGVGCSLLTSLATPSPMLPPHSTWEFLGKTLGSARVAPVVVAQPRVDVDLDLETCTNIQQLLPHDGAPYPG